MCTISEIRQSIHAQADSARAKFNARFFRTGKGQYGEGDVFLGLTVPQQRKIAKLYHDIPRKKIGQLLHSKYHEHRFIALAILAEQFARGNAAEQGAIYRYYLQNASRVNNWDLVDASAHKIVGRFLLNHPRGVLRRLARSSNLWERRIAIISTLEFIAHKQYDDTLVIADILLQDKHDLIHKAVGWMLREVGKKSSTTLESFLRPRYAFMPRTMLRYAIERFPKKKRLAYLKGKV